MSKKKSLATIDNNNEMVNFYAHKGMKQFLTEYENPHFDSHGINPLTILPTDLSVNEF
jgi:hypothetical protein